MLISRAHRRPFVANAIPKVFQIDSTFLVISFLQPHAPTHPIPSEMPFPIPAPIEESFYHFAGTLGSIFENQGQPGP
jgi:hypothetical protein